jgi:hypothetical protein
MPWLPLKPMGQSRRGVIQSMEAQVHPMVMAIPRFIQIATFLLFYLLFFASNLPIKPLEQVKIAWLMLEIDCRAHQHGQKTYSVAI